MDALEVRVDYLLKPFTAGYFCSDKVRAAQCEESALKEDRALVTQNPTMLETLEMARGVALSDVAVVITVTRVNRQRASGTVHTRKTAQTAHRS